MTTAPDQQTFDQILEQTFPKDIQQKRIRKELISLNDLDQNYYKINLQNSSLGLKVVVEFTELFIQREIQQNSNLQPPIILELLLDPQFPFNLPKLFCRTSIFQPSLADGRDFLEDAIERPWYLIPPDSSSSKSIIRSPTILLREVITSIPTFLKKINRLQDPADSQKMGQYYIGDLYSLEDMLGYETVNLFTGDEVIEKKSTAPRYIVVAESHFLKFEAADNSKNTLKLLTWANLNSIANIKRSKDDERSVLITFLDKEKTNGIAQLMLLTKEATRLEELLLDSGERYGAKIKQGAISDFDLTPYTAKLSRQITEKNVEEALEDIHQLETRLEIEVTKDLVYTLMAFYQKTVEHFANYDDPLVDEFVGKLRSLMEREDVQTALKNNQENEERKKTQTLTKQKTIDTDIEDEEEKKESNEPYSWQDQDDNNASIGGDDRVVISQSQKLEVQRPVPAQEEVQNQQEENEWKEYESKGTEEAEKESEYVENKPQEEQAYEAQENIENRQEEQYVEPEPQYQQEQQEEYIPAQEEAQIEQKWQEEEREVVENQENKQEEFEGYQENKQEEFEGYQQEQQQAQEFQQENQQYVPEVQEEQAEAPVQQEDEFAGYQQEQQEAQEFQQEAQEENQQYVQEVQEEQAEVPVQYEEPVVQQYEEPVVQQYEEPAVQQYEEPVFQQYEEPVQQEEVVPEQKEEEIQREEQEEEVQVQENKEEEAIVENEEKREEAIEENQVEEQNENIEAKAEEVVPEPVEEKEEVIENKEEVQVQENKEEVQVQENQVEEQAENKPEEAIEEKEETKENQQEEAPKVEENQEEQSPEKAEGEPHENEGEGEEETQEQGQGEGNKKNKKKKNKKKK